MTNSIIKLTEITQLDLGTKLAHLQLTLENKALSNKAIFSLQSTGMSLRLCSDHLVSEIKMLTKWLEENSSNEDNLRTNDGELRILAQRFIKLQKELDAEISL